MNTKMLLLGTVIATLAATTFASDTLLSPRGYGNQIKAAKTSTPVPVITVAYVDSAKPASVRAAAAQIKVVKGIAVDQNPVEECRRNMNGSPRAVTACTQSVTMPGCMKLAVSK